jgi:hypothetical protein
MPVPAIYFQLRFFLVDEQVSALAQIMVAATSEPGVIRLFLPRVRFLRIAPFVPARSGHLPSENFRSGPDMIARSDGDR